MLTNHTKISVIIPSYNSFKTIKHTLDHLHSQTKIGNILEIIVVDSSDDNQSKNLLNNYKSDLVKVVTSGIRVMPGNQRNIGANLAIGSLLCFIDSDAYPAVNWIERILSAYELGHCVGYGSYGVPDFQLKNRVALAQYYLEFNEFINTGKQRKKKLGPSCNLFCDKELFLKVGGFPQIRASEDAMFGLLVGKLHPITFLPDALVYHIFRENVDHYYHNQVLLGKFVFVYRKFYYNTTYLKGILPALLLPVILTMKAARIILRIIKAGPAHFYRFLKSSPLFFKGLFYWGKGFNEGRINYTELAKSIVINTKV